MKTQPLKGLGCCVIYRQNNTQDARQVGMIGAGWRALPLVRLSPADLSLRVRIAQHSGLPEAKIERT